MQYLAPLDIRFSQDSIRSSFQDGRSIMQAIIDIRNGRMEATDFPTISVIFQNGNYYTGDNRRLYVFRVLQCEGILNRVPVYTTTYINPRKFTTYNQGVSIRVRQGPTLPHSQISTNAIPINRYPPPLPYASRASTSSSVRPISSASRPRPQSSVNFPFRYPPPLPNASRASTSSSVRPISSASRPRPQSSVNFPFRESFGLLDILTVRPSEVDFSLEVLPGKLYGISVNTFCEYYKKKYEGRKIASIGERFSVCKVGGRYTIVLGADFNRKLYICRVLEYHGKLSEINIKMTSTAKLPQQCFSELHKIRSGEILLPHSKEEILTKRMQSVGLNRH
ncbi:uncharacterized protein LOC144746290 isoform X1 [Ciona intestinalis]